MLRPRLLPIGLGILLTGCLQSTTTMQNLAQGVCTSGARTSRVALTHNITVAREAATQTCETSRYYACSRAVFSPDVQDGRSVSQECAEGGSLGTSCIDVDSQEFDTRAAIAAASLDPTAPGTYNHTEYTCYNTALKADQAFPASGLQHASLTDALQAAHKRCNEIAAALPSAR